ncbi:hypothetical protein D6C85_06910 [Aureobasidium pullulans]|uniref:F-box domain-containing protein n=1 Tax=Aureobasidium pullulans TaxID=5580 RepID=A0A4S9WTX5_AURPU|nr:hypothetical protein D6C85_06910 [Aureobasidium pullulans]
MVFASVFERVFGKAQKTITKPFGVLDLPHELLKIIMIHVDDSSIIAIRSTCTFLREESKDRFLALYFTDIEIKMCKKSLQKLLSFSDEPHLVSQIKSLVFAIPVRYYFPHHLDLITEALSGLSQHGKAISFGVASEQENHIDLKLHVGDMMYLLRLLRSRLVEARELMNVPSWKIIIRTRDFRNDSGQFVYLAILVEIHDGCGQPTREINISKKTSRTMQAVCINLNCDVVKPDKSIEALDELELLTHGGTRAALDSLVLKQSTIRKYSLRHVLNRARLEHLGLEDVRIRDFNGKYYIPGDWLETFEDLIIYDFFDSLKLCRLTNLFNDDGEVFVEDTWEFTATPGSITVTDAIRMLISNVKYARSLKELASEAHQPA